MDYSRSYNASEFYYKLSLLKKLPTDDDLILVSLSSSEFTYNKVAYNVSINGLQFHRKVYEPNHIMTELVFTLVGDGTEGNTIFTQEELQTILVGRKVMLTLYPIGPANRAITLAQNYYVYEICPQVVNDSYMTKIFVKLDIFSMDHLMTLNKYSKAYTIKKLGSGILRSECKQFILKEKDDTKATSSANTTDTNECHVEVYHDNMKYLRYEEEYIIEDVPIKIPTEYIQPYLVQYNETFYEFLARTANRCGEFLFFEDGVLTLGMPKDGGDATNATKIEGYRSVTFPKLSNSKLDVSLYTRDSIKGSNEDTSLGDLNDSEIEKDVTGYPTGIFGTNLSYNSELSHDEYIFPLFKDKFADFNSVFGHKTDYDSAQKILMEIASESLSFDDNLPEKRIVYFFKELILKYGKKCSDTAISVNKLNDKGNDAWFNSPIYKTNPQQVKGSKLVPFASTENDGWLKLVNYSNIRKKEEEQRSKIVCIDMGANCLPVKIGQMVTIDKMGDMTYVIIEVKQCFACGEASHTYLKYENEGSAQLTGGELSQLIFAIPLYKKDKDSTETEIVPPLRLEPYFKKSGPQTAFVVSNSDPKSQGRVRIAYPWQTIGTGSDKTFLDELKKELKEKENAYTKAAETCSEKKAIYEYYQLLTKEWEDYKKVLEDSSSSDEKKKEACNKLYELCTEKWNKIEGELKIVNGELNDTKEGSTAKKFKDKETEIANEQKKTNPDYKLIEKLRRERDDLFKEKLEYEEQQKRLKKEKKLLEPLKKDLDQYHKDGSKITDIAKKFQGVESDALENYKTDLEAKEKARLEYEMKKTDVESVANIWIQNLSEVASPWVRVAMPMATYEGGVMFKPQVGDEVLVNFDNDNVERPYVAGSLYSKEHIDPKEEMVIKSPSGQKISFKVAHDGWDFLQGVNPLLKTLQTYVPEAKGKGTLQSEIRKMAGDITMKDEYGMFEVSMSSGKRAVNIKSPFGNVNIGAFTGINITAPHGDIKIKGKNVTIEAGNNLTLLSGTNVYDKERDVEKSLGESYLKSGADTLFMLTPELKGGKVVDINLLRCFFDVLLRPVEGTLCVKSNNYLKLEAGKGKAEVPLDRYTQKVRNSKEDEIFYAKVTLYIKKINQIVTQFCSEYDQLWQDTFLAQSAYDTKLGKIWGGNPQPEFKKIAFQLGSNPFKKYTDPSPTFDYANTFTTANLKAFPIDQAGINLTDATKAIEYIRDDADSYGETISKLHKKALDFNRIFEHVKEEINRDLFHQDTHDDSNWIDTCFEAAVINGAEGLTKFSTQWNTRFVDAGNQNGPTAEFLQASTHPNDELNKPLWIKRKLVLEFLLTLQVDAHNTANQYLTYNVNAPAFQNRADETSVNNLWAQVSQISRPEMNADLHRFDEVFGFSKTWNPLIDTMTPKLGLDRRVWNDQSGKIIFSENKNVTFNFNRDSIEKWDLACIGNEQQLIDALTSIQ